MNALSISDETGTNDKEYHELCKWNVKNIVSHTINGAIKIVYENMTKHIKLVVLNCLHHELIEYHDVFKYAKEVDPGVADKLVRETKKLKIWYPDLEIIWIIPAPYNFIEYNYNAYNENYGTEMSDDWYTYVEGADKFGHTHGSALHYIVTILEKLSVKFHCLVPTRLSSDASLLGYGRKVILVGDDQLDAIKFEDDKMQDIYRRVLPGFQFKHVMQIADNIVMNTTLVGRETKLVVVMPFLNSIVNNGDEWDPKMINKCIETVCFKTKKWMNKCQNEFSTKIKILWVLPHSVDLKKYCKGLSDGQSLSIEKVEHSFLKSYERLRNGMELCPLATLSIDNLFDELSLSDDGITMSKSCSEVLSQRLSKLINRLDTDNIRSGEYKVAISYVILTCLDTDNVRTGECKVAISYVILTCLDTDNV